MEHFDRAAVMVREFTGATLGHGARTTRLATLVAALAQAPAASVPAACGARNATKRAYEFLGNPHVHPDDVRAGHVQQTVARCATRAQVLLVLDLTELDFTRHRATRGLGPIGDGRGRGLHVLTVLALDAATGEPLGILHEIRWVRPVRAVSRRQSKESSAARKHRTRESQVWQQAITASARAIGAGAPATRFVVVADQGADIFENFAACHAVGFGFVLRVYQNRLLAADPAAPAAAPRYLLAALARQTPCGVKTVEVVARPGHAARVAHCALRTLAAQVQPPQTLTRRGPSQALTLVAVQEAAAPAGEEALSWVLATTEPVATLAAILAVVTSYERRWTVEDYHMGLKTGCALEARQFQSRHAIENFLAIAAVLAWQMLWLRHAARAPGDAPPDTVLAPVQVAALRVLRPDLPHTATARDVLVALAALGGHLGRRADGPPGWRTIWRGFQKLLTFAEGYAAGCATAGIALPGTP